MFKIILLCIFCMNTMFAFAEQTKDLQKKMNFKYFAKLSAILNQCELNNMDKENLLKFSKEQGLKLARKDNLSNDQIAKNVAYILFELDKQYEEDIPSEVCIISLREFNQYMKQVTTCPHNNNDILQSKTISEKKIIQITQLSKEK